MDQPEEGRAYSVNMQAAPVDDVPQRVVSLVPCLTEALFDLDLGGRLVGISDDCIRPSGRLHELARVGRAMLPDIARVAALNPDLVLMDADDHRPEDAEALRAAGIPVWIIGPRTVFDALNVLWNLMDVFDHAVMVPRVREIERAYDYAQGAASARIPSRVFVPLGRNPWKTFGVPGYAQDVLRVCGGVDVFAEQAIAEGERYREVSEQQIIDAQPEVILLPDTPYGFGEAEMALVQQWDVPAARSGRIFQIEGDLLTWYGTRVAYALRDLPGLLMGEEA